MIGFLTTFAEEATAQSGDLLGTLGIDWGVLILQAIAFIVLVVILAKFVYPPIVAMLDRRDKVIEDSLAAAKEASEKAATTEKDTAALLENARLEAKGIIDSAKKEAAEMIASAEGEAEARAATIVAGARADIQQDVEKARKELRGEVVDLVTLATEKIIDAKIVAEDEKIIKQALEGKS